MPWGCIASSLLAALLPLACGGGAPGAAPAAAPPLIAPTATCSAPADPAPSVSVKDPAYGARGDGVSDDTAAIQKAVNAVAGTGGTLTCPDGIYLVDAVTSIRVKGGMTLQLAAGAVLRAIPNAADSYSILTVAGASNVTIQGGTLQGDYGTPVTHTGSTGEWGMGLSINGSSNVSVYGVTARDCWGDGFTVALGSSNVALCSVSAVHNRRNGLSITYANTVAVRNSSFMDTGGTLPEDGLDIEPNPGETVNLVAVSGCTFSGNAGDGIADGVPLANTGTASIANVSLSGNSITGNGARTLDSAPRSGIELSNASGHTVTGNTVTGNTGNGILLRDGATGMTVTGNQVQGNTLHGILNQVGGNVISGNAVSGNGLTP